MIWHSGLPPVLTTAKRLINLWHVNSITMLRSIFHSFMKVFPATGMKKKGRSWPFLYLQEKKHPYMHRHWNGFSFGTCKAHECRRQRSCEAHDAAGILTLNVLPLEWHIYLQKEKNARCDALQITHHETVPCARWRRSTSWGSRSSVGVAHDPYEMIVFANGMECVVVCSVSVCACDFCQPDRDPCTCKPEVNI